MGKGFNLAEAALIASGAGRELGNYLRKIELLHRQILADSAIGGACREVQKAKELFHWLWKTKPHRYQYQGNFQLTAVLEAQLEEKEEKVGNCLGLTLLYHVLAQKEGLQLRAVHLEEAFDRGPHIFSVLYAEGRKLDIEHILPEGFDYPGHMGNPEREEWGDKELVADVYHSQGNHFFEQGDWGRAVENYRKALELNPRYAKARLNLGMALVRWGKAEEARLLFEGDC